MEQKDNPGVVAPPPLIYIGFGILGAGGEFFRPSSAMLEGPVRYLTGGGLIVAALALAAWAILEFRSLGTNPEPWKPSTTVVGSGPFRFSRNPMYLSLGLVHLGIGFLAASVWIVATLAPALIVVRYGVIGREERYLEGKFGEAYTRYKKTVRRWL